MEQNQSQSGVGESEYTDGSSEYTDGSEEESYSEEEQATVTNQSIHPAQLPSPQKPNAQEPKLPPAQQNASPLQRNRQQNRVIEINPNDIKIGTPSPFNHGNNKSRNIVQNSEFNKKTVDSRVIEMTRKTLETTGQGGTIGTFDTRESMPTGADFSGRMMGDYELIKKIGQGSYSSVYKCRHLKTGKIYAIKSILYNQFDDKEKENILNEIRILASIDHPNIIGYRRTFIINEEDSDKGDEVLW